MMYAGQRPALPFASPWSGLQDPSSDEHLLPGLQELLDNPVAGPSGRSDGTWQSQGLPGPFSLEDLPSVAPVLDSDLGLRPYNSSFGNTGPSFSTIPVNNKPDISFATEAAVAEALASTAEVQPRGEIKQESVDSDRQTSPTGSTNSKDAPKAKTKAQGILVDKKTLAKQRYREKNRKAQARHRERNKKTIENLTAKVSSLTAENSGLKLEMAIVNTLARAKDEHYSKLRKCKENLAYVEAESLIAESYQLAKGAEAEVHPERLKSWCMQDSAAVRQESVKRMAALLVDGGLNDITSEAFQRLQTEVLRKRQLSLRFAVGKPRFVRSLYAWEREYSSRLTKPDFNELWRTAAARQFLQRVMRFSEAQRTQLIHARALLLVKMHTILNERRNLVAAVQAGAAEGVADLLVSSLEEERQAVFGFLFSFFDETLTVLQECSCDVELYPWAPDVLAVTDVVMEDALSAAPNGIEGLNLPAHLVPLKNGRPNYDALMPPADRALASPGREILDVAFAEGVTWPPETPFQLLSVPVTTRSCGTAGISILRNVLMFASGVMPVQLPNVPPEILTRTPMLRMIKLQPSLVA